MAHMLRPFFQWPRWRHRCRTFSHILSLHSSPTPATATRPFFSLFPTSCRQAHSRALAPKSRDFPPLSFVSQSGDESSDDDDVKKSRNERKREARRAVRWGMELAKFSQSQIKRIIRVADLEQEVYEAIMLVKGFGREVREGKRRQYNYIGRLLREVEPELMDGLIQATKDGDHSKFQDLLGTEIAIDDEEEVEEETSDEEEEEDYKNMAVVTRWFDGLINKDIGITNEIYSLREVDFDRQELRQLVRKMQSASETEASLDETGKAAAAAANARKSLARFLRCIADQLPVE